MPANPQACIPASLRPDDPTRGLAALLDQDPLAVRFEDVAGYLESNRDYDVDETLSQHRSLTQDEARTLKEHLRKLKWDMSQLSDNLHAFQRSMTRLRDGTAGLERDLSTIRTNSSNAEWERQEKTTRRTGEVVRDGLLAVAVVMASGLYAHYLVNN
jgi:hypothetical protein